MVHCHPEIYKIIENRETEDHDLKKIFNLYCNEVTELRTKKFVFRPIKMLNPNYSARISLNKFNYSNAC